MPTLLDHIERLDGMVNDNIGKEQILVQISVVWKVAAGVQRAHDDMAAKHAESQKEPMDAGSDDLDGALDDLRQQKAQVDFDKHQIQQGDAAFAATERALEEALAANITLRERIARLEGENAVLVKHSESKSESSQQKDAEKSPALGKQARRILEMLKDAPNPSNPIMMAGMTGCSLPMIEEILRDLESNNLAGPVTAPNGTVAGWIIKIAGSKLLGPRICVEDIARRRDLTGLL